MDSCKCKAAEISGWSCPCHGLGFVARGDKMKTLLEPSDLCVQEGLSRTDSSDRLSLMEELTDRVVAGNNIRWNPAACREAGACGRCEELCPTGILDLGAFPGGHLEGAVCLRCRLCLHVCPTGALSFLPLKHSRSSPGGSVSSLCL